MKWFTTANGSWIASKEFVGQSTANMTAPIPIPPPPCVFPRASFYGVRSFWKKIVSVQVWDKGDGVIFLGHAMR